MRRHRRRWRVSARHLPPARHYERPFWQNSFASVKEGESGVPYDIPSENGINPFNSAFECLQVMARGFDAPLVLRLPASFFFGRSKEDIAPPEFCLPPQSCIDIKHTKSWRPKMVHPARYSRSYKSVGAVRGGTGGVRGRIKERDSGEGGVRGRKKEIN